VFTDRFAAEYEQFKCRAAGVLVIVTAHLEPVARTHDDELTAAYRSPCGTNAVKARRLAINPRALVLTLAFCGIRWGEAIALRVRDIEFLKRRLVVSENAVQLGVNHAVGTTKGRKARSVPVSTFVLDELSIQCRNKAAGDLVFSGPTGGYLPRPKSTRGWFAGAVSRAKVPTITPHDLRHTCASLSVSAGMNVLALQRMLGHTSAKVTLDTYADLFDADLDAVAATLHATYSREMCPNVATGCP
jgi:integrase